MTVMGQGYGFERSVSQRTVTAEILGYKGWGFTPLAGRTIDARVAGCSRKQATFRWITKISRFTTQMGDLIMNRR